MNIIDRIKSNKLLKKAALLLLMPNNDPRPRLWVRLLVNPFVHKKGSNSIIRNRTRLDVFPFNKFYLGNNSIVEDFSTINNGVGNVIVGNSTIIGLGSVIIGPVVIGNDVMIAQNIVISGLNHAYENINLPPSRQKVTCSEIIIHDNVWIGANSVITAGVTIGKHSVVGGGSVVTKSIPEYSVVVGNPAKMIKKFCHETNTWLRV